MSDCQEDRLKDLAFKRMAIVNHVSDTYDKVCSICRQLDTIGNLDTQHMNDLVSRYIIECIDEGYINNDNFEKMKNYCMPLDMFMNKYRQNRKYKFSRDDVSKSWNRIYNTCSSVEEAKNNANKHLLNPSSGPEYEKSFQHQIDNTTSQIPKLKELLTILRSMNRYEDVDFRCHNTFDFDSLVNDNEEDVEDAEEEDEDNDVQKLLEESIEVAASSDPINYKALIEIMYEAKQLSDSCYWDEDMAHIIYDSVMCYVSSSDVSDYVDYQ